MPELQTIYIRSENARCYHYAQTLITAPQIAKRMAFTFLGLTFLSRKEERALAIARQPL